MADILIVDDHPHVIRVLSLLLAKDGHQMRSAHNGQDGLAALRTRLPDVLITDITMPVMSGREMCLAIAGEWPERRFPILVMTALTGRSERSWVETMNNIELLEKPVSPRALAERVNQLLGRPAGGDSHG